jgi:hypothetical protein
MANIIDLYNRTLAPLMSVHNIDLEAIKRAVESHVI